MILGATSHSRSEGSAVEDRSPPGREVQIRSAGKHMYPDHTRATSTSIRDVHKLLLVAHGNLGLVCFRYAEVQLTSKMER